MDISELPRERTLRQRHPLQIGAGKGLRLLWAEELRRIDVGHVDLEGGHREEGLVATGGEKAWDMCRRIELVRVGEPIVAARHHPDLLHRRQVEVARDLRAALLPPPALRGV